MDEPLRPTAQTLEERLEQHRAELTAHCDRMLASPFEAEDAVQETLVRAWSGLDRFEGRASLRSWLYRIATNVCVDMLKSRQRRARLVELLRPRAALPAGAAPETLSADPLLDAVAPEDPAEIAVERETIRLAFVAALERLPPRQRAALLLCEVLRWQAAEAAELLETTVASVNSALQRARAAFAGSGGRPAEIDPARRGLLARYVRAFEADDVDALTSLIAEDASARTPAAAVGC